VLRAGEARKGTKDCPTTREQNVFSRPIEGPLKGTVKEKGLLKHQRSRHCNGKKFEHA
jgi:hypothetical protein